MRSGTQGAVAAGSAEAMEAGLTALRAGGNAVDAAVAATLMACVSEPALTGLGGAGLATLRINGEVSVFDLFTAVPGLGRAYGPGFPPPPMDAVNIDFGPTTQAFHAGPGSVALPGLALGLHALHRATGRIDLEDSAAPAIRAAREGVTVSQIGAQLNQILWHILQRTPEVARLYGPAGRPLRQGERFTNPGLADTMRAWAHDGDRLLRTGLLAEQALSALGDASRLTEQDLRQYQATRSDPLRFQFRDATVWLPGPPSVCGLLVLAALRRLEQEPRPPAFSAAEAMRVTRAFEVALELRREAVPRLFDPRFLDHCLHRLRADRGAGYTTHISAVDRDGNAIAITQSLGETSGCCIPGSGIVLNNFLGEADVNPPEAARQAGERLMTMTCPALVQRGDHIYAMGSGGSSRIRAAILHGILYLAEHGLDPAAAVAGPRTHLDGGVVHVESGGRSEADMALLAQTFPGLKVFEGTSLFFGGLHTAGLGPAGFEGAGDARRCGVFGVA